MAGHILSRNGTGIPHARQRAQCRVDLAELRVSARIGPVTAGAFLILFAISLGVIRSDAGELHPLYWPIGLALLLIEWELTRRLILGLSRLTYR